MATQPATLRLEWHLMILQFFLILFLHFSLIAGQQQAPVAVTESKPVSKILIPDLPAKHYQFWLKNHPKALEEFRQVCSQPLKPLDIKDISYHQSIHSNLSFENPQYLNDLKYGAHILETICSSIDLISKSCWGYENNCQIIHLMPECYGSSLGQAKDEQEQKVTWFSQGDFGYILDRRRELAKFCSPDRHSNLSVMSSFECTKSFRFCRGDNLFINLPRDVVDLSSSDFKMGKDRIGGWNCDLQRRRIEEEGEQKGKVQTWFSEFGDYSRIQTPKKESCDFNIEKRAFIVKLGSTTDMYKFFSNFVNLYATIHMNNWFTEDNQVIIWSKKLPATRFDKMWSAFSKNPPLSIGELSEGGKRVCLKKFATTILSQKQDEYFYGTPLISGCQKSGLFDAFNKHVTHRLKTIQRYNMESKSREDIRVTMFSGSEPNGRISNEVQLKLAITKLSHNYIVQLVDPIGTSFEEILDKIQNTDILIGFHNPELTYTLFLPDWASLFEVHDFSDKSYEDLARLRGVNYFKMSVEHIYAKNSSVSASDPSELRRLSEIHRIDRNSVNFELDETEFLNIIKLATERTRKNRTKYFESLKRTGDKATNAQKEAINESQAKLKAETETMTRSRPKESPKVQSNEKQEKHEDL